MFVLHQPGPPLSDGIECFWYAERRQPLHARERALPTGAMSLTLRVAGDPLRLFAGEDDPAGRLFSDSIVWGPQSSYVVRDTARRGAVLGVQFRPGRAGAFLGVPANLLLDRHVPLADLWGAAAACELAERVALAATPSARFAVAARTLLARLAAAPPLPPCVAGVLPRLLAEPTLARVTALRESTGYSPKRFNELFTAALGLPAKRFSRIRRFQAVVARLAAGRAVDWPGLALDGGFYDQAHLLREFRAFSGLTPSAYRPVRPEWPNHVALPGEKFVQDRC